MNLGTSGRVDIKGEMTSIITLPLGKLNVHESVISRQFSYNAENWEKRK